MTAPTCATCRWWQASGECKRMPPIGVDQHAGYAWGTSPADAWSALWPRTKPDDWCGEHAPKGEGP